MTTRDGKEKEIRAIVIGCGGRMGKGIIQVLSKTKGIRLVGGAERKGSSFIGRDLGEGAGIGITNTPISDNLGNIISHGDVLIDFTKPEATMANVELAALNKKDMVIGTTGLLQHQIDQIKKHSRDIRIVQSPNMSVGVNVLFQLVEDAAHALGPNYDIEIIEAHHRHKKDAPSGTALKIAEILAHATKRDLRKVAVYGRKGVTGERRREEIGIHVIRGGDIAGDHTIAFCGEGERVQLTHIAHNRNIFAQGAVLAALWLSDKKPGLYNMRDVIGLK